MNRAEVDELLARARTELGASRVLMADDFAPQAIVPAYYAAFYAAEAALLALGETRSKHSGVISAFGQLIVKPGGVERSLGSTLRDLFEARSHAQYDRTEVTIDAASSAVADAERFVSAVEVWLRDRSPSDDR